MARVCVGCGLTTDAEGLLILNTETWPWACDQEDQGSGVYCSPVDGIVRTDPPVIGRVISNNGEVTPPDPIEIAQDITVTVDTMDITLTNPSPCYTARALVAFEADVHIILDPGDAFEMDLNADRYVRLGNSGDQDLDTVSFQMSRHQTYILAPGAVLGVNMPIDVTARNGDIEYTLVNWRIQGIIVASR